jgi:pyruvate,water dikinase
MGEGIEMLARVAAGQVPLEDYLGEFGHRATCDYEVIEPRFWECPDKLLGLLQALRHGLSSQKAPNRDDEILVWNSRRGPLAQRLFLDNWDYLKRYESLKETAKHYLLMEIDLLRRILVKMGERKEIDLFYLTAGEVWGLARREHVEYWRALAEYRRREREVFEGVSLPQQAGVNELEGLGVGALECSTHGEIKGICVSGNQAVRGIARVLRRIEDLAEFQPGEILVAKFTEPSWSPLFKMAGGIVTEIGGLLSHTSILAREYKLMTIVSANKVTERIKTGDEIVLRPDGVVTREETT